MGYAQFAETGHLCLATLHANNANQALDRILNFFPEERHQQVLMDLSLNMRSIISQRLLPIKTGRGRVAAVEILLNTPLISDMIFKGEIASLKEVMSRRASPACKPSTSRCSTCSRPATSATRMRCAMPTPSTTCA
jgi:twitching motility protein PilU